MSDMKNRITDADAELLLAGRAPEGLPGSEELAAAVTAFRSATVEAIPRPSAELAARLSVADDELFSARATSPDTSSPRFETDSPGARTRDADANERAAERVSRFGLAARVAVGVGALLLGITVAGAAGALPGGVQDAFDDLVSTVTPGDDDDKPVIIDEEPAVDDESVDGEESGGDDLVPGEPAPDDGEETESPSDDADVGDGEESDGDSESDEPDEDAGEEEPDTDSSDSDSSDTDDD
ncbi:hypothetical protein [Pseudolysinimonas sp.]|uniref:hypothetical protein n=1 Tax=Pseudolysinimonas sp. TaxID=2680009 RepID=UPI00286C5321|nr:hypothetical protein [Pseudolysinimonas sp.]